MNEIILKAKANIIDKEAREYLDMLAVKIDTINERTKSHTRDIQELRRMIKCLK